jgi:hypothetical protein
VPGIDAEGSRRGALAELASRTGNKRHALMERIRRAAKEEMALTNANKPTAPTKGVAQFHDMLWHHKPK